MKTMQEVQTLISDLQQFYTDVRLLDAAAIERIEEGVRSNPNAEDLCYACHHCAVKSAFENHDQRTKLEYFSPDIVQVSAQYMEVDGAPYVLELLQRMHSDTIVEPDDTEALFSALSGYNTKLYHDPLTDMYNRRYYEEIVRGMKGPIGVALMDLDDFKVYNDTYGHHAGDMALKTAATIVRGCIRQTDALVRFGGDEFLLILPGIPEDYFKIKLEGICEKIHDAIVPGYSHMRLSTSIGGLIQMPSDSMDAVVRQADRLMYQAKVRKNCVVVSGGRAAALFSATLTPPGYYRGVLGCPDARAVALESPFPPDHLGLYCLPGISTRYRDREASIPAVSDALAALAGGKVGNYLAFFPSYAYLRRVYEDFTARYPGIATLVQESGLDDAARAAFLQKFTPDPAQTLLGFGVMGGIFGEGVDLVGDRLIGCAIVGVGLPQVNPRQEILRRYYDEQSGTGFDYAYRYPGMNKVLQAAGRVIRTAGDRGVVLLLDDRFARSEYTRLFPRHWQHLKYLNGTEALKEELDRFWGQGSSR